MSEHEQPWVHCGSCPVCESGLRRLRCEELTDGYQELFALCDECEAIWMVPDPEAKLQFPDPENPTSPWSGQPLYGSHSRWATPEDIVGTVWESVAQVEGEVNRGSQGEEWQVLADTLGPPAASSELRPPKQAAWRIEQAEWRARLIEGWSTVNVERFRTYHRALNSEEQCQLRAELDLELETMAGSRVLEIGPGLGRVSRLWLEANDLEWVVLEPSPTFAKSLHDTREFQAWRIVEGFCDSFDDRGYFPQASFTGIFCANVANELYDPLTAFQNMRHWLRPGGWVCVVDGLLDRTAWDDWGPNAVDQLPLAANQSPALLPYLLQYSGFEILTVKRLPRMDAILGGRHPRYLVKARSV